MSIATESIRSHQSAFAAPEHLPPADAQRRSAALRETDDALVASYPGLGKLTDADLRGLIDHPERLFADWERVARCAAVILGRREKGL